MKPSLNSDMENILILQRSRCESETIIISYQTKMFTMLQTSIFFCINTEFIYQYKKAQKGGIPQIHPLYVYMLFMFVSKNIRTCVKYECKSDDFLSVCDLIM